MRAASLDAGALARADLLLLLAGLLTDPAAASRRFDADLGGLDGVIRLSGLEASGGGPAALRSAIEAFRREPEGHALELAELFAGPQRCPPNETAYIRRDKGAILGDIAGFYRAFGLEPAAASGEKADHVATEIQFVALLLVMLARAEASAEVERAEITRDALRSFAGDHLGEWLPGFTERLAATADGEGWRQLAAALERSWALVARSLGVEAPATPPEPVLDLSPPDECGGCPPPAE
jgi:TorA maturation chaperone TorD